MRSASQAPGTRRTRLETPGGPRILVLNRWPGRRVPLKWLVESAVLALKTTRGKGFGRNLELSVVLTGDGETRRLNRLHRKKDRTTDVLSFPLREGKKLSHGKARFIPLGDVVLNVSQALRQARKGGKTLREELALLLVHGVLHLLGYDHATAAQEKKMFGLQGRILGKLRD